MTTALEPGPGLEVRPSILRRFATASARHLGRPVGWLLILVSTLGGGRVAIHDMSNERWVPGLIDLSFAGVMLLCGIGLLRAGRRALAMRAPKQLPTEESKAARPQAFASSSELSTTGFPRSPAPAVIPDVNAPSESRATPDPSSTGGSAHDGDPDGDHVWLWMVSAATVVAVIGAVAYFTTRPSEPLNRPASTQGAQANEVVSGSTGPSCSETAAELDGIADEAQQTLIAAAEEFAATKRDEAKASVLAEAAGTLGVLQVRAETETVPTALESKQRLLLEGLARSKESLQQYSASWGSGSPAPTAESLWEEGKQLIAASLESAGSC